VACLLTGKGVEPEFSAQGAKAIHPLERESAVLEAGRARLSAVAKHQRIVRHAGDTAKAAPIAIGTTPSHPLRHTPQANAVISG
jgi:hypothetical protein